MVKTERPVLMSGENPGLTRHFPEFSAVPIAYLPYIDARCQHTYDGAVYRATGQAADREVTVAWQTLLDRKRIVWPAFPAGAAAYDLSTVICSCQAGQIWLDGVALAGKVRVAQAADGTPASSAFLAFAESWVGPVAG